MIGRTLGSAGRYVSELKAFLRTPLGEDQCARIVRDQLARRQQAFIHILRHGVFGHARSPYLALLARAGATLPDLERLVLSEGVEESLRRLSAAGVFLTIDEFKGRKPVCRDGLEFRVRPADFDSPLIRGHYEARTGGSRGTRSRVIVDLGLLAYEAAQTGLFLAEFGLAGSPTAMWREAPPGMVGVKNWLRHAKLGRGIEKWYAQQKPLRNPENLQFRAFTLASRVMGRAWGSPMPAPEHVPPSGAIRVARWMAEKARAGTPALMDANASTGVRICLAALEAGLDISGSFFRLSAEPYTEAKARVVAAAGCRAASFYSASELGYIGLACGDAQEVDDAHVMLDKVALVQRRTRAGNAGPEVDAFLLTSLLPSSSKILLNVELGDCGIVEERECGCRLGRMGFQRHIHHVRSFEKLTSGGNTFLGQDIIALVERTLPDRFGGTALDYQFTEREEGGLPVVQLRVSPRVGPVPESDVLNVVFAALASVPGGALMTGVWRASGTLRIVRADPVTTGAMKLLPLHVMGDDRDQ